MGGSGWLPAGGGPLWLLLRLGLLQPGVVAALSADGLPEPAAAMLGVSAGPVAGTPRAPGGTPLEETRLQVFTLDYLHVQIPFEITLWILLASLAKIGE